MFSLQWIHNVCFDFLFNRTYDSDTQVIFSKQQFAKFHSKRARIKFSFRLPMLGFFSPCPSQLPPVVVTGIETLVAVWRHPWYGRRMPAVATHPVHPPRGCLSTRQQAHFLWSSLFLGWAMFRALQRPERISQMEASTAVVSMAPRHSLVSVLLGLAWNWDLDRLNNLVQHCFFFLFSILKNVKCVKLEENENYRTCLGFYFPCFLLNASIHSVVPVQNRKVTQACGLLKHT